MANFCITISDIKIQAKNDFNTVPAKIKGVSPSTTPIYLITGSKIKYRLVCELFTGRKVTLGGKTLRVSVLEPVLSYIQNRFPQQKNVLWMQKLIRLI